MSLSEKKRGQTALKAGTWYTISNVCLRSVSILTAPIFTRLLTPSDYGHASNFITWMTIILIFTGLSLSYSFGRAKIDFPNKFDEYISSLQVLSTISAFSFFIFAVIFSDQLAVMMNMEKYLVIIMFLYLIFHPSVDYVQTKYRFEFRYKENILITFINTVGVVVFSLLFIYIFNEQRHVGRIIGLIIMMFALGIFFYIKILITGRNVKFEKMLIYWKYALQISLPMIPHAIAIILLTQIDRIMIMKYIGSTEVGIYSFGYSYAILLAIFSNSIAQAWVPWLYQEYNIGKYDMIKKVNSLINLSMGYLTILFITIAPEVLQVLGTEGFYEAKWIVAPIAIGALCQYFYGNYASMELYHKKTTLIAIGTIAAGLINLVLNFIFIPRYGYIAAGYTTMISYVCLTLFHWINYRRIIKAQIFDDYKTLKIFIGTVVIGFTILFLYDFVIIRYSFFIILLIFIFITKREELYLLIDNYKRRNN